MVTYRCGSGRERAPREPSASDVCADVRTIACRLTIRFVCRQKLDRSATAHWRGQVAISTAVRRRVARNVFSICEERGDGVRAIEIVMLACASALRFTYSSAAASSRHCERSEAIHSLQRIVAATWIASLRSQRRWIQFRLLAALCRARQFVEAIQSVQSRFVKRATRGIDVRTQYRRAFGATKLAGC